MKKLLGCFLCVMLLVFGASSVMAVPIDLTDTTNPAIYTGITGSDLSIWKVITTEPTGTGVYQPFLRYQDGKTDDGPKDGVETGFNTNLKPPPYEDKMPSEKYTRSVLFADLGEINVGGTDYWSFTLDFNEPGSGAKRFLSFDNFDIYEGSDPYAASIGDPGMNLLFDSTATVLTDYTLASSGSGKDDIEFLIPVQSHSEDYMFLYITSGGYIPGGTDVGFGRNWEASGGFEEVRTTGIPSVPEPATMFLLGAGLIGLALFGKQRFKK